MKALIASLFVLATSISALADSNSVTSEVAKAFFANEQIQAEINKAKQADLVVAAEPGIALLGGGCGFAGCESKYLVTLPTDTQGSNTQTTVIAAIVKLGPAFGMVQVKPVDVNALLAQ